MKTLLYSLKCTALKDEKNNDTAKAYKTNLARFADFAKGVGVKSIEVLDTKEKRIELVNSYVRSLTAKGLSAASIHTYIAPVCKGLGLNMKDIDKPKRRASEISKSRSSTANPQGRAQANDPANRRLVSAAKAIGLRRDEYSRLTGAALQKDVTGAVCVMVKGKGGKIQHQRILPSDVPVVRALFAGKQLHEKIFSKQELDNKIDLHGLRAAHAREAYRYYANEIKNGNAERLKADLLATFRAYHPDGANPKRQAMFLKQLSRDGGEYKCRGENRARAIGAGESGTYNRLATLCVSVFHLAHWRLDVTVRHYFL